MICSKQIISNNNREITRIELQDILELRPTAFPEVTTERPTDIKNTIQKSEWHELTLLDKHQHKHILHAYTGVDFFSLWNILLMIKRFFE